MIPRILALFAAIATPAALAQAPINPQCSSDVARRWLREFNGDGAFSGLILGPDGRSATLQYTGREENYHRLVPLARQILAEVVQPVYSRGTVDPVSMFGATILPRQVEFSLRDLIDAEEQACDAVVRQGGSTQLRIDVQQNRVVAEGTLPLVARNERLVTRPLRQYEAQLNLRDFRRPLAAGTQILLAGMNSSTETCTLGFIIRQGVNYRILTASHCTPQIFSVPVFAAPEVRQNGWTIFDGTGTEVSDPGANCTSPSPGPCRTTDSAITSIVGSSYTFGAVATPTMLVGLVNPACKNNGACSETTWNTTTVLVAGPALQAGQTVEHIGRTSGRVFGTYAGLVSTPTAFNTAKHGAYSVGRAHRVTAAVSFSVGDAIAWPGDSGGPVVQYYLLGYIPLGVLFASRVGIGPSEPPDYLFSSLADIQAVHGAFSVR